MEYWIYLAKSREICDWCRIFFLITILRILLIINLQNNIANCIRFCKKVKTHSIEIESPLACMLRDNSPACSEHSTLCLAPLGQDKVFANQAVRGPLNKQRPSTRAKDICTHTCFSFRQSGQGTIAAGVLSPSISLWSEENNTSLGKTQTVCDIGKCSQLGLCQKPAGNVEVGISFFAMFSAILRISRDQPVVTGGGNRSTRRKPPPNPKSLVENVEETASKPSYSNRADDEKRFFYI